MVDQKQFNVLNIIKNSNHRFQYANPAGPAMGAGVRLVSGSYLAASRLGDG